MLQAGERVEPEQGSEREVGSMEREVGKCLALGEPTAYSVYEAVVG